MYMYVCIYICICIRMYLSIYIHTYIHAYIHTYMHAYIYVLYNSEPLSLQAAPPRSDARARARGTPPILLALLATNTDAVLAQRNKY